MELVDARQCESDQDFLTTAGSLTIDGPNLREKVECYLG